MQPKIIVPEYFHPTEGRNNILKPYSMKDCCKKAMLEAAVIFS